MTEAEELLIEDARSWARGLFRVRIVQSGFENEEANRALRVADLYDSSFLQNAKPDGLGVDRFYKVFDEIGAQILREHPAVKRLLIREWSVSFDDVRVKSLIREADSDRESYQTVGRIIKAYLKNEKPLPEPLRDFLFQVLEGKRERPKPKRGWNPAVNHVRNTSIKEAVLELMQTFGFKRTRNPTTEWPSACSIVAEALSEMNFPISEKMVAQITKGLSDSSSDLKALEMGSPK